MFERYITNVMTEHFGHVIANLDPEKMKLTAWNGCLVLTDVELHRHALGAQSPVEIANGTVGRLEVRIPWKTLRSLISRDTSTAAGAAVTTAATVAAANAAAAVDTDGTNHTASEAPVSQPRSNDPSLAISVVLTDVNILLTPRRNPIEESANATPAAAAATVTPSSSPDEESDPATVHHQSIQSAMDAELLQRVALSSQPLMMQTLSNSNNNETNDNSSQSSSPTWRWKLQERLKALLQNLSVTIENIHIRYEDPGTCLGFRWQPPPKEQHTDDTQQTRNRSRASRRYRPSFAMGVTLKEFSIQSMDDDHATLSSSSSSLQHKQAAARQLAAYWDSDVDIMADHSPIMTTTATLSDTATRLYFQERFGVLNDGGLPSSSQSRDLGMEHGHVDCFRTRHAFVLDPFSPSIRFGLASALTTECSTMDMQLPPCRFSFSRSVLEDVGYLRKSFAVWTHAKLGLLLPEGTLRKLTSLRPDKSPKDDPRKWWKYAYAAVLALAENDSNTQRYSSSSRTLGGSTGTLSEISKRRPKGWLGLSNALGRRRKYVNLYKDFLFANDKNLQVLVHATLLDMEHTLLVSEVVAFRIAVYDFLNEERKSDGSNRLWHWVSSQSAGTNESASNKSLTKTTTTTTVPEEHDILSDDSRCRMFVEMALALQRQEQNTALHQTVVKRVDPDERIDGVDTVLAVAVAWKTSLQCSELSLQVMDAPKIQARLEASDASTSLVPIVRLSCAFTQEQTLYKNGSWDMTNRIGSFVVKDCTSTPVGSSSTLQQEQISRFSTLVGSKSIDSSISNFRERVFQIDGTTHQQSIWCRIQRVKKVARSGELGSTTTTTVRVLPLEIVYSTAPVESLNHVFNATTVELADDYSRLASRMSAWRERQKMRLFHALAHKEKIILVDIVVGAPILLLPEGTNVDSPVLSLTLGELQFSNDTLEKPSLASEFDDVWRMELKDIQVQRSSVRRCLSQSTLVFTPTAEQDKVHQLIEPFSLQFAISTKFENDARDVRFGQTSINIHATLPRLVVNLTSSAVHLLKRLQMQWDYRRNARQPSRSQMHSQSFRLSTRDLQPPTASKTQADDGPANRILKFHYIAPWLNIRFERDTETSNDTTASVPIIDLSLKGIEGKLFRESSLNIVKTSFGLKVRTLGAVDLYQRGGQDFTMLLSSVAPEFSGGGSSSDLVTFDFESQDRANETNASTLSIKFNELYVEWNPETLATLNAALSLPVPGQRARTDTLAQRRSGKTEQDEDEFFDADGSESEDDSFFDATSGCSDDDGSRLLSEIHESERSSLSEFPFFETTPVPWSRNISPARLYRAPPLSGSPWSTRTNGASISSQALTSPRLHRKPLEVSFELSKLRMNFNKDSRRRRVVTAEMDGTSVRFVTMASGGSQTSVTIGNLSFSDCECMKNNTLYREIIGLQTGEGDKSGETSSLLEMEMIIKPKSRQYVSLAGVMDDPAQEIANPVSVDFPEGVVHGFDNYLQARLSPMRFVFLEQLWFEIVDYFFSGIIANEVWGSRTPAPGDKSVLEGKSITANAVSFTRFDVLMESPEILFPVSSCSTDFIRLEAESLAFCNKYTFSEMRPPSLTFLMDGVNKQWYNNCEIKLKAMTLHSWSGNTLNETNNRPAASIVLSWPVGPSAPVNIPKWKVKCNFEELRLDLDRPDYSLLQNIVQFNIGDESHHLEEWRALQALPPVSLQHYLESISVNFGYDKKDTTPSTFDVTVNVPLIIFTLKCDSGNVISAIQCSGVCWTYRKLADRISRQSVTCGVDINCPTMGRAILSSEGATKEAGALPDLTYSSIAEPSGNNTKSLQIVDAYIDVIYSAWRSLSQYFQHLPQPTFLSPNEAIQVGDRWYRITENSPSSTEVKEKALHFEWIDGCDPGKTTVAQKSDPVDSPFSKFEFSLVRPGIRFDSESSALVLSIENVLFSHKGQNSLVERSLKIDGVEVQTRGAGRERRSSEFSLIRPWCLSAYMNGCNGKQLCGCTSHAFSVQADTLFARASFSDILKTIDIGMSICKDMKSSKLKSSPDVATVASTDSNESKLSTQSSEQNSYEPKLCTHKVKWEGLRLAVTDDSGRHFAGDQDLVVLRIQDVRISRNESIPFEPTTRKSELDERKKERAMDVFIRCVDIVDCLQSEHSPFRSIFRIRQQAVGISPVPIESNTNDDNDSGPTSSTSESEYAIGLWSRVSTSTSYRVDLRSIEMQYNPSVVVALQRFIGRLRKEAYKRHDDFSVGEYNGQSKSETKNLGTESTDGTGKGLVGCILDIGHVAICLNKEHQNRRLLHSIVENSKVEFEWSAEESCVKCHIGAFQAVDPNTSKDSFNSIILRSSETAQKFIKFKYLTFANSKTDSSSLPEWVSSHLQQDHVIDDFLDISISNVETTYFRGRTEELLDYLSNGMPGKGMGATSRVAKGFVKKRIQKRSYFNVYIEAPTVSIPQSELSQSGLAIRLGDVSAQSWIVVHDCDTISSRMVSIVFSGVSSNVYQATGVATIESEILSEVNVSVDGELSSSGTSIAFRFSDVVVRLAYVDYVTTRQVLRQNVGRKVDKEKWDNLEVAWEREFGETDADPSVKPITFSNDVAYSSSARLVRYGRKKNSSSDSTCLSFSLFFSSLSLVLRKNEIGGSSDSGYDMLLIRGQGFDLALGQNAEGDKCLNLTLNKIYVFDLGSNGNQDRSQTRYLQGVHTLVDGYSPPELIEKLELSSNLDSQVVVKIDEEACPTGTTKIVVVVSFLSICAVTAPLTEVTDFFSCRWSGPLSPDSSIERQPKTISTSDQKSTNESRKKSKRRYEMRFVSNYPRLVFPADQSDAHSRAIVLQGLSIANASFQERSPFDTQSCDSEQVTSTAITVDADFQEVSSQMNPDVYELTCIQNHHMYILNQVFSSELPQKDNTEQRMEQKDLSVPLLLPLTVSLQFEQTSNNTKPKERSLGVSVEPVSLMLSMEDLELVRSILDTWAPRASKELQDSTYKYDRKFTSQRLGLGLRKDSGRIVVDNVANNGSATLVQTGDTLHAINGDVIGAAGQLTLADMVSRLASEQRPMTITFLRRSINGSGSSENLPVSSDIGKVKPTQEIIDKIDVSLSAAIVTLMERDVPLFKGSLSKSSIKCNFAQFEGKEINLELLTSIGIEYYNLRLWGWEPCLESGTIALSASFQEAGCGDRELAVEIGDRGSGLSLNVTDSLGETVSKLLEWRADEVSNVDVEDVSFRSPDTMDEDNSGIYCIAGHRDLVALRATNAAFRFARRQTNDTAKPFVFRNMTGLSVAFVSQQKRKTEYTDYSRLHSYVAVGDYAGLQEFDAGEVMIVASEEELNFRMNMISFTADGTRQIDVSDHISHFPCLTVALQEINGITTQPIKDLHIDRPGEILLPLSFKHRSVDTRDSVRPRKELLTWLIEQVDERTVVTLGTSIRLVSMLDWSIELGIKVGDNSESSVVKSIGSVRLDQPFCLPLWLSIQRSPWICYVRLSGRYKFAPVFFVSCDGEIQLENNVGNYIECQAAQVDSPSAWIAVLQHEEKGILTVSVDCAVSLHNMLPSALHWEICENPTNVGMKAGGSFVHGLGKDVKSGENAEVLSCGWQDLSIRLRPSHNELKWSAWSPLKRRSDEHNKVHQNGADEMWTLSVRDVVMLPLPVGLRVVRKPCGLDVTIYAEMWCTNNTSLNVVFGCPKNQISNVEKIYDTNEAKLYDLSAAEATLMEISSLFESGESATALQRSREVRNEVMRLPSQTGSIIVEECFEYHDIEASSIRTRWWATENPFFTRENIHDVDKNSKCWDWIDKEWNLDKTSVDGWDTSSDLSAFSSKRLYNRAHRYRRRRWTRRRKGLPEGSLVDDVNAYFQLCRAARLEKDEKKVDEFEMQVAVQVEGGKWSLTSMLPRFGKVHGVLRAAKSNFADACENVSGAAERRVYELCYAVSPLDGEWGMLSRSFLLSSRFLLRNDSEKLMFEVKQAGTDDSYAIRIGPGQTDSFHWEDFQLPELVCVRPFVNEQGCHRYKWSGGFDPLTIGPIPLRMRKHPGLPNHPFEPDESQHTVHVVRVEVDIRSRTGGTGINLSFREEDPIGEGSLYKIENMSLLPIWISQDGVLSNPSSATDSDSHGDVLSPGDSVAFALDVPYRQGKYKNRKAASTATLLRARLALAPLSSRAGVETTKVVSLVNEGERVQLYPSKLAVLSSDIRNTLRGTRIFGFIHNDGPTRVLTLRLIQETIINTEPVPSHSAMSPTSGLGKSTQATKLIFDGAVEAAKLLAKRKLLSEEEAVAQTKIARRNTEASSTSTDLTPVKERDLVISFRASFGGLIISMIDSAPAEIAVIAFRNLNAIATWDMLRQTDSTIYLTVKSVQVDNMVPNAPFPVAVCPFDQPQPTNVSSPKSTPLDDMPPILVVGLSVAPKHKSGIVCLKSATVAPRNLAIMVDLAFLVRLQKFALDMQHHFHKNDTEANGTLLVPNMDAKIQELNAAAFSGVGKQKFYFGGLTILPCNIKLSVAPARALTAAQAALEGPETSAIHQAVRKGDIRLDKGKGKAGLLGVKLGSRNKTPLAVVRGLFKSFVVDGLLRLDGASLNFAGLSLRNHTSTGPQLSTALGAHYLSSLRQNLPALLGSMAAFGNPLGLVRGLGEGVGDFVLEPVRGLQRSVQEMDASHLVDGVARGTLSLARHTVGGFADSAAMLTETFSKNMAVLTLDRRYAQKRDRGDMLREHDDINVASGLGSGVQKLVSGFLDGVTGVVKAPIRGAEKRGFEGFAKGLGKGLLGLLVKPMIGISDGLTDVMIGVKGTVDGANGSSQMAQLRPRRALYGRGKAIRSFNFPDAAACALMLRTRLAGEAYLTHLEMGNRVALLSVRRVVILGRSGEELLVLKLKHIESVQVRTVEQDDAKSGWGIVVVLNTPRQNGSQVEVIVCQDKAQAVELSQQLEQGQRIASVDSS